MTLDSNWVDQTEDIQSDPLPRAAENPFAIDLISLASARSDDPRTHVAPPGENEKYLYLKNSFRFFPLTLNLLFLPIILSLIKFAMLSPYLWIFGILVAVLVCNATVGALTSNKAHRVTFDSHRNLVNDYRPTKWSSIDVFLPCCNEPIEVLINTYKSVADIAWPGLVNVYILDDAGRDDVKQAANHFDFNYHSRANRGEFKKAGNLRSGFDISDGDFILILDADFTIRNDALFELMPYFSEEKIGIVQSPQFFDISPQQNWLQQGAGATQELFYRWIQPSRDRSEAAICVGTCAIYRRQALADAGGFAQIEHSEDVHTGVKLAKAGYYLRYIPVVVAKGLCPSEPLAFISQQYRWATGSLSLLTDKSFYKNENLKAKRKLPYFTGFMYYITTGLGVYVNWLPGPIILWFFPELIKPENYLPLSTVLFSQAILLPAITNGRYKPKVARVQMLYSFAHSQAILDKIRNTTQGWVATGESSSSHSGAKKISRTMKVTISFVITAQLLGFVHATAVCGFENTWPALIFTAFYIYISFPLLLIETSRSSLNRKTS
jgi:cellulose synthase (UDP-forming)